jgi:WS/DGAT/MGAT family acyltransferase
MAMVLDRLSADDRLILWPDAVWPQDVGALAILDGGNLLDTDGSFRIDAARDAIERRLHLLPRFRQILYEPRRGLGGPLWVDSGAFDPRDHVRVAPVPTPGDEAQLLAVVEDLRRRRLDRSRPLWEMWFLPGLPEARVGLFVRLHHVVADGLAGMTSVAALLDAGPDTAAAPPQPWAPAPWPSARDLFVDNLRYRVGDLGRVFSALGHPGHALRGFGAAWPTLHELLAEEPGPKTSLHRLIGPRRNLALVRGSVDAVKEAAHGHEAKVNDVLLTVIAGGLHGLLQSRGEPVDDLELPIYVPVSLRRQRAGQEGGNLITQMVVPLPLSESDPARRLRRIAAATAERKAMARPSLGTMFRNRIVGGVMLKLVARQRVNVVSADLPGPVRPLYFAGARLLEVFPLLNLIGTVSLGVGALSYAGQFNIMVVADADSYPDLDVFAAAVQDQLRMLTGWVPLSASAGEM